jgi:uncharacterized repeat protein (TIGR03803 family)
MDQSGNVFGATEGGGSGNAQNAGTLFELMPNGSGGYNFNLLYSFCAAVNCSDGKTPYGSLVVDTAGNLYGVTLQGGANAQGEVFELVPNNGSWTLKVLYSFCTELNCPDGAMPSAGLTYAGAATGATYDGTSPLYGVTEGEGSQDDGSVVYTIQPMNNSWVEQVLYSSSYLGSPLLMDATGNLYTTAGSADIELSPAGNQWNTTILYAFCSGLYGICKGDTNGTSPTGGLVIDGSGRLWGVTVEGGHRCRFPGYIGYGCGTIYSLTSGKNGYTENVEYDFCAERSCPSGGFPRSGLTLDSQGNMFGTALWGANHFSLKHGNVGDGTLFELSASGAFSVLYSFCSVKKCRDGTSPYWGVIEDASGDVFGTTLGGGARGKGGQGGVVYEFTP